MHERETVKVWDILVRIFHWSLVAMFAAAWLTGEGEVESLHALAGYVIIGLLAFRIVWGFIGSRYARFTDFIYRPSEVKAYLASLFSRHPKHYFGHNPAGGLMVIVMLVVLGMVSWSGLQAEGAEGRGPLAAVPAVIEVAHADDWYEFGHEEREKEDEFWEEVHEFFVNLMLVLVFVHIAGVVVSSALHRENLVKAMVTGRKELPEA